MYYKSVGILSGQITYRAHFSNFTGCWQSFNTFELHLTQNENTIDWVLINPPTFILFTYACVEWWFTTLRIRYHDSHKYGQKRKF